MLINYKTDVITRAEQKQLTRQKLIEATMEVIAVEGFSGVTMAKVAEKACLSRGIANFHFRSKEQLLLEILRTLHKEFDDGWKNAVADAGSSPVDQLKGLIKTTLNPPIADFRTVAVWLAFWGEAPPRKKYLEIYAAYDREWDAAVENIIRQMVDDEFNSHGMTLAKIAQSLTAMIDGFWVRFLISGDRHTPEDAVKACFAFLSNFFPEFEEEKFIKR